MGRRKIEQRTKGVGSSHGRAEAGAGQSGAPARCRSRVGLTALAAAGALAGCGEAESSWEPPAADANSWGSAPEQPPRTPAGTPATSQPTPTPTLTPEGAPEPDPSWFEEDWPKKRDQCDEAPAVGELTVDGLFEAMVLDLEDAVPSARPFLRYVSLAQTLNSGSCAVGTTGTPVRNERTALTQFVNSLSLTPKVTPPRPVDAHAVLYAIDLRDYGWDRAVAVEGETFADAWEALAAHTDNAHPYAGPEADRVRTWTDEPLPLLNLPAALSAGLQHPLYSSILHLPSDIDSLMEAELGAFPPPAPETRAGFSTSGVDYQQRLIERWERADGAGVWRLFSYRQNTDKPSLFAEPLSSEGDGGQLIFPLPNGLHAYALFDATGALIQTDALSVDPAQELGRISAAGSCFSCHHWGIIPFGDQVGPFVKANREAFSSETLQGVEERYLPKPDFDDLAEKDSERYVNALEAAGVPRRAPDRISAVNIRYLRGGRRFEDRGFSRAELAGELMVTEATISDNLDIIPLALRRSVPRPILNQHYLAAYCALHKGDRNQLEACSE